MQHYAWLPASSLTLTHTSVLTPSCPAGVRWRCLSCSTMPRCLLSLTLTHTLNLTLTILSPAGVRRHWRSCSTTPRCMLPGSWMQRYQALLLLTWPALLPSTKQSLAPWKLWTSRWVRCWVEWFRLYDLPSMCVLKLPCLCATGAWLHDTGHPGVFGGCGELTTVKLAGSAAW